jgi:3-hydroxybutyryl-CoA dehydrogenase
MNILIIGNEQNLADFHAAFPEHHINLAGEHNRIADADQVDLIVDFLGGDSPRVSTAYPSVGVPVMINSVKTTLSELLAGAATADRLFFGFNGLPGFASHDHLEVTVRDAKQLPAIGNIIAHLGKPFIVVDDRVGMVTPRIICMIINEAYYTVQERTASREDIDLAMKLGTNYPFGPFEWCDKIGIKNVYSLLEALYLDTRDERYKIAPLMKQEYLREVASY